MTQSHFQILRRSWIFLVRGVSQLAENLAGGGSRTVLKWLMVSYLMNSQMVVCPFAVRFTLVLVGRVWIC